MSGSNLPYPTPPAEVLSPREAQSLGNRLEAAVSTGAVRETPRVDGLLDRLQVAAQMPSQAQRDTARQAAAAATPSQAAANQQAQQQAQATARAARL